MTAEALIATAGTPTPEAASEESSYPTLSPSRAADFKTCPLLYRFRTIDKLPERATADQVRGTLVHAVLERLFDLPAAERTPQAAAALLAPQWQRLLAEFPELAEVPVEDDFLSSAGALLDGYFRIEDPRRFEPAERESLVATLVNDQLLIRGYIDRLDVSPAGDLRVVDYKTGGAPREAFEARALFQLKFYALVLWRTRGVVPRVLRLIYLKDAEVCDYAPDPEELLRFERTVLALWRAIEQATTTRDFRPRPSRLCGWCSHQQICPAFGGTPPPFPEPAPETRPEPETPAAPETPSMPVTGSAPETRSAPAAGPAPGDDHGSNDDRGSNDDHGRSDDHRAGDGRASSLRMSDFSTPAPIRASDQRLPSAM
jgi:putative RecB family exonuclease